VSYKSFCDKCGKVLNVNNGFSHRREVNKQAGVAPGDVQVIFSNDGRLGPAGTYIIRFCEPCGEFVLETFAAFALKMPQ
jgi:hypothetical protein